MRYFSTKSSFESTLKKSLFVFKAATYSESNTESTTRKHRKHTSIRNQIRLLKPRKRNRKARNSSKLSGMSVRHVHSYTLNLLFLNL